MGRRDEAIELLSRALEQGGLTRENRALALSTRAYAYQRGGEYPEAVADYDAALSFGRDPITLRNRGAAYLEWSHFDDAAEDFTKALSLQPSNAYLAMWLHLARLKAGAEDMRELVDNLDRADLTEWPRPLLAYLAGREALTEVMRQAEVGDPVTRAERRCDVAFFLGEKYLADGHVDALRLLREAREVCPVDSIERAIARVDMLRAGR